MLGRILAIALIAGVAAGLVATAVQGLKLWPLIAAAERIEQSHAAHETAGHAHDHEHDDWAPADGPERAAFTVLFNILAGVGFALVLNGALLLRQAMAGSGAFDVRAGLLWGLAGFACFALAPALGLPPELPGMASADLLDRQIWWVLTALATACGIALMAFGGGVWKVLGVAVLAAPHLYGAPRGEEFGAVPAELAAEFVAASLVAAASFWLVLGGVSGWLHRRLS